MENGQVEKLVNDTSNGTKHLDSNLNLDSKSMKDTVEFRLMMAYPQRRRPRTEKENGPVIKDQSPGLDQEPPQTPEKTEKEEGGKKKRKNKTIRRHLKSILRCVRPQTDDAEPTPTPAMNRIDPGFRCLQHPVKDEDEIEDEMRELADQVIRVVNEIQFTSVRNSEVELDSGPDSRPDSVPLDDDLEKVIGLLLREDGDRLNEKFDLAHIATELFYDYNFFRRLLNTFLVRIGFRSVSPDSLEPQAANRTQIAATCEITSRLSSVAALPKNRLLQHGAQYLQEYYSAWAQEQGGYEAVFHDEEEVD
ncbi:apoptosis facilitator Bcl-2-like protein 14 [Fundulus heteroclitus]|uniref:apoptosis facilitator Bcl-2-like protein 14 n=1 Tax=Fundulus heteroclitus TaxID=8078 RepID=UPI00165CB7EC|nr:apoptosis facilitator Bcl-2-like protein 14 [Fundulus heteroclitus]